MTEAHPAPPSGAVPENPGKTFAKYEETEIKRLLRKFSKKARRARKVLSEHDSHLQPGEHSSPVAISQNVRKYLDKKRLALRTYDELIASFENDLREIAAELATY